MAQVLLFHVDDKKSQEIYRVAEPLGLPCLRIPESDSGKTLAVLTGREPDRAVFAPASPLSREMLVMDDLNPIQFRLFLDSLRLRRISVLLKAVVTEHNLPWTAAELHRELLAEHTAIQQAQNSKQPAE